MAGVQESLQRCVANAHTDQKPIIQTRGGGEITSWVTGLWQLCSERAPLPQPQRTHHPILLTHPHHSSSLSVHSQREAFVTAWQLSRPPLALATSSSTAFHIITSHHNLLSFQTWRLVNGSGNICISRRNSGAANKGVYFATLQLLTATK